MFKQGREIGLNSEEHKEVGGFIAKENEGQGLVNRLTRGGTGIRGILAELAWQDSHCRQAGVLVTTWWTGGNEELGQVFKMITCRG